MTDMDVTDTNSWKEKNLSNEVENPKQDDDPRRYDMDHESCKRGATGGEVDMEANITADDVARAGGFGTRDDISSFLPVAADSTDFEASLRDAKDFEEPLEEKRRPGLGWTEAVEKK
ncbi:hypothetical protein AXF42_Ash012306 [Apostasia shenzhenica]|uniref:Uncharacterized protein n=1 Tax=Apostasia shenzhenica TaxID=1088818 RepID=A0A2I0ACX3_9ASPA|nr:hypothetical protein AXF42_Ash012306 [Apostasia shenzhenica]